MNTEPSGKILLLAANPIGSRYLRLGEEMREIQEGLKRSRNREHYSIAIAQAVRYRDIHRAILEYEPQIIHFSGHGAGEEGLVFEDEMGRAKLVDAEALAGLFQLFSGQVECVVLNACYSQYQAEEIARHINYALQTDDLGCAISHRASAHVLFSRSRAKIIPVLYNAVIFPTMNFKADHRTPITENIIG